MRTLGCGRIERPWSSIWLVAAAAAAIATFVVSCGGDGGTCAMVNACGGDIVGEWRITSSCLKVSGTFALDGCTQPATVSGSVHITGTASYRADLTYTTTGTLTGSESVLYPAACLSAIGVTCADLNQSVNSGGATGSCASSSDGGCRCNFTIPPDASDDTGTYSTSGGTLITTPSGSPPDSPGGYCVQGSRLDMTPSPSMMPVMMDGLTISGDIALMRQ
jgi:hypothetical protein